MCVRVSSAFLVVQETGTLCNIRLLCIYVDDMKKKRY